MKKMTKIILSLILVLGMIISPLQGTGSISASAADENPMRALWLRPKETSKAQVEAAVQKIYNAGINTIFLETVFNGYTIFPVTYDGTYLNPDYNGFDVLGAYVDACHSRGMQLHCWVESFFIGMAWEDAGGPVYKTYKDKGWLLTDNDGNNYEDTMYGPMYFLNPARPECRDWIVNLYAKFVSAYDVDGIQLDYCRYPEKTTDKDYGYDDYTINAFIEAGGSDPTNAKEGSAVATAFVQFKQEQVTKFVKQCSDTLRALKPDLIISLSVYPFYSQGKSNFMQSAGLWMEKGYGDLIVPMAYYENQIDSIAQSTIALAGGNEQNVVIGLLTQSDFSASSMKSQTNKVLDKGAGVAYFEYESFFGQYNGTNYSTTLKQGPLSDTQFNIDPSVYKSYVGNGTPEDDTPGDSTPSDAKGYLTRANSYKYGNTYMEEIFVFASEDGSTSALSILGESANTFGWFYNFVLEYNSAKDKWIVTKADFSNDGTNQYQSEELGENKLYVMFHGDVAANQADSCSFFLNTVAVGQEYWLVGDWDTIASSMDNVSGVYLTTQNPDSSNPGTGSGGTDDGNTDDDASENNGWVYENGGWYYYKNNVKHTGWLNDNGEWYYMNANGKMVTGWIKAGEVCYYLNSNGTMATGWVQDGGSWYYLNSNGAMVTGWVQVNGSWYYLNSNGAMATGWVQVNGEWYYMNANGKMVTGWIKAGEVYYYLNSNGTMATGWVQDGGSWYYLNSNGTMATGWIQVNGTWYYMYSSGRMASDTWVDGYYLNSSGAWVA